MHEQLAALSQGPIVKPKKKKEKKEKKEKKKKKKIEKRSRAGRSRAGSEEWKMPGKMLKSKSARAGVSQVKKAQTKKSNKNNKLVAENNLNPHAGFLLVLQFQLGVCKVFDFCVRSWKVLGLGLGIGNVIYRNKILDCNERLLFLVVSY